MNDQTPYPQRKSPRLAEYDYSQNGAYFVTICTHHRANLFGAVSQDGEMIHNAAGNVLWYWWNRLATKYELLELDAFVFMPNHIHAIMILHTAGAHTGALLHEIVGWFKTMTTNAYIKGVKNDYWYPFAGHLWQRSFHDHIIRDEESLNKLREYVLTNPAQWAEDRYFSD